jgi:hypothetical protein
MPRLPGAQPASRPQPVGSERSEESGRQRAQGYTLAPPARSSLKLLDAKTLTPRHEVAIRRRIYSRLVSGILRGGAMSNRREFFRQAAAVTVGLASGR